MLRRLAPIALIAALVACAPAKPAGSVPTRGTSAAVSQPSGARTPPPSAPAEQQQVTVAELLAQPDVVGAFGGSDLRMDVRLGGVGVVDCPSFSGLEPDFFHCSHLVLLGTPDGGYPAPDTAVFAVFHPEAAHLGHSALDRLVTVTAHYDDPAAATCHFDPYQGPPPEPPAREVVSVCRSTLVITAIYELQP
jgi:hypothetical protein